MTKKNKTILITGGAGFIGSNLAKKLLKLKYTIIIVDNFNAYYSPLLKKNRIKLLLKEYKFKLYKTDIANFKKLEEIFKKNKIDIICHLAAQAGVRYSLKNPFIYERSNLRGTLNLLELSKKYKIKGFIFASSSSVYGTNKIIPFSEKQKTDTPVSLYAATKKSTELIAYSYHHLYEIPITGLRFFTVYGPWGRPDMALFKFTKNIMENKPIDIYNYGKMKRDFTYIDDIVNGIIRAIKKNYDWQIFNLGRGEPVELIKFVKIIENCLHKKAKKKYLPIQPGDVCLTYANISKAKKLLGYIPKISVEQGIKKFINWYKSYYLF